MSETSIYSKGLKALLMLASACAMAALCLYLFLPSNLGVDSITTATVKAAQSATSSAKPDIVKASEPSPRDKLLLDAFDSLDDGDMNAVIEARDKIQLHDVDRDVLTWLIATSGHPDVSIGVLRDAQKELENWPGQDIIARNIEIAMARDPLSLMRLRLSLDDEQPTSFQVAFALAKSYLLTRNPGKARALLTPYWHKAVLSRRDEARVLETFGSALTERDHEIRFFNMMSRNRITAAGRLVETLGWSNVHQAWASVIRRQKSALDQMSKLSEEEKQSSAYAFMRTEFLRRSDRDDDAIKFLAGLPTNTEFLINPDAWWDERRIISRHKFEAGAAKEAYDLVAVQEGGSNTTQVDAAFHAGWYALRGLNKPEVALEHFKKIIEVAKGDISLARGFYWMGRALGDTEEARDAYAQAAKFDTTYYGWLAREELGLSHSKDMFSESVISDGLSGQGVLRVARRLSSLGQETRARQLYLAIGRSWSFPQSIKRAALQASADGDHFAALKIAKAADWRGIDVGSLTHPIGAISDASGISATDHALAYAIARQESEFNIAAVSRANAKGIMQVLPGTAKEMARKINVEYEPTKLTSDANYNARLGVAYLNEQLNKFGGSYVLTFVAYNAGPSRAKEWVERFGDPRGRSLHAVIDWIEMIPFPETRSYVQRIIENLQVYKTKLGQTTSIADDLRYGTTQSN